MLKIIQQGAEAVISLENNTILKNRISKGYRLKEIDQKLRKLRTRSEAKIINKLNKTTFVPKILESDEKTFQISMEYIQGEKLSQSLEDLDYKEICRQIADLLTKLHNQDIIHGDLTTSNMILNKENNKVYLIDFGLAFHSHKLEDKAVDIHLLKQALEAKHFKIADEAIKIVINNYKAERHGEILEQLKKVESRGRYKERG